jgi:hypothetical protein
MRHAESAGFPLMFGANHGLICVVRRWQRTTCRKEQAMTNDATTSEATPATEPAATPARQRQVQVKNPKAEELTFGIEVECFVPRGCMRVGARHAGIEIGGEWPVGWQAESDGSLSSTVPNYMPVELVSPILKGADGIAQIRKVGELLARLDARVNTTCGFHVHVGAKSAAGDDYNKVADWVRRLLLLTAHHEMALYGAAGTRRRYNGRYCASLRQGRWAQKKDSLKKRDMTAEELRLSSSGIDRYQLLNVQNLFGAKQTVEFRVFSGTMESLKMIAWVQMCLALATRALDHTAEFEGANARYASNGARGAMKRFYYLMGWTRGRKDWYLPTCQVEGWVADLNDLKPVKKELMRLAKKFDASPAV